jgi:starch phosphorylase
VPARELFRSLDLQAWRESEHNPIRMLTMLPANVLQSAAQDREFLAHYDAVMDQFEVETATPAGWFAAEHGRAPALLAYFSAEYGLHASLPVYAGGLGILAGDHLKECSDLGVPVVAVGMIYSRGYVWQRIREDGWQEDVEQPLDRTYDPITPVLDGEGRQLTVQVPLFDPPLHVAVWKVAVGRVGLYLMDADLEVNQPWDRGIAHHLYAGDLEQRLRQEIVLGMGGMRVLEALSIHPAALHLNEGHPARAILERIRALVDEAATFEEAAQKVRESTIFTTHTPLPAGTDVFPFPLMDKYLSSYYAGLGTERDTLLSLGTNPQDPGAGFNMTVFALRAAGFRNAVSQRHGQVARGMWAGLWPDKQVNEVPIEAITNGVHLPSWIEPTALQPLLTRYLGPAWLEHQGSPGIWKLVDEIPDGELWHLHQHLKGLLTARIDERIRERWWKDRVAAGSVIAFGALLDPEILTLGFARRFTGYKRPDLILYDLERLKRLLTDPLCPVQIVFAGKAHPADGDGKRLIQRVFRLAQDPGCAGRIAFVEDYDQQLAEYLVHGVDVWLNNPLPPLEASGTSGMKAAANGVPNLSILDGWWIEGHGGANGWAFGEEAAEGDRGQADAEALYSLLEEQVVPLYYERSDDGVSHGFVQVMKASIKRVAPAFSARRMVKEYAERFYIQALRMAEEFKTVEGRQQALRMLADRAVDGLVVIGGNGSQTGAHALSEMGFPVIGVASTIDNDLYGSEITIGVDTALNVALEAIDRLKVTASSHHRAFLVEVMGRECGYLALMAGIAGGAEVTIVPEVEADSEAVAAELWAAYERGKPHALAVVAEGARYNADGLAGYFKKHRERLGFDLRVTVLGHVQRGGTPGAFDRLLASRLGAAAVERLAQGEHGVLVGLIRDEVAATPLDVVVANKKPLNPQMLTLARVLAK